MKKTLKVVQPSKIEMVADESNRSIHANEVKLQPIIGGICGSDVSVFKGKLAHAAYPVTPGHEVVAKVIATGEESKLSIDDTVVIVPNSFCDHCENCLQGKRNICLHKKSLGVNVNGIFSSDFIIEEKYVLKLPENIDLARAALTEPFAVIVHAFKKINVTNETSIAIIGCGTEGMLATSLAAYKGAQIAVVDVQEEKLAFIQQQFEGIETYKPEQIVHKQFDIVIECAGVKSSVEQSFQIVKPGGKVILIGLTAEATIPVTQIVRNEVTIEGSIIYDFPQDFETSLQLLSDSTFKVDHIISKTYKWDAFEQAYTDACSGKYGKILIDFN